jgi:hypothetical protein
MTDKTIDLDQHRGSAAQKATDLRRLLANVEGRSKTHYVFRRMNWKPVCSRRRQQSGTMPPRWLAIFSISSLLR